MDTDRALARSIASLISTPKRRKLERAASDDPAGQTPEKAEASSKVQAPQLDEQGVILSKLFAGLEDILVLFSKRGRRAALDGEAGVRADVEAHTRRDLSAERLGQILALAEGMLEASWLGTGLSASLELVQRAEDGDARPPTLEEQTERRMRFDAALAAAAASGKLPSRDLPPRPPWPRAAEAGAPEEVQGSSFRATSSSAPAEGAAAKEGAAAGSPQGPRKTMEERIAALRDRMLARNEADKRQAVQQAALRDLERRAARCEDAMALHAILEQLFARGRGEDSAASEAELMSAATSRCYSAQFRRPMDHEVASAALDCLTSQSADWYRVEAAVHSRTMGSVLKRTAGGCSKAAMEALKSELNDLKEQHRKVLDGTLVVPAVVKPAAPAAPATPAAPAAAAPKAVALGEPAAAAREASPVKRARTAASVQSALRSGRVSETRPPPARTAAPAAPSTSSVVRKRPAEPAAPTPAPAAAATAAGRKRAAEASPGPAARAGGKQAPAAAAGGAARRGRSAATAKAEAAAAAAEARKAAEAAAAPEPAAPPARRRRRGAAAEAAAAAAEQRAAAGGGSDAMAVAATMPGPVTRRRLRLKLGLDES